MSVGESKLDEFEIALGHFNDIKMGWETKKSCKLTKLIVLVLQLCFTSLFFMIVGWELSVRALQSALLFLDTPESEQFLADHFVDLIRVLGMQKLVNIIF